MTRVKGMARPIGSRLLVGPVVFGRLRQEHVVNGILVRLSVAVGQRWVGVAFQLNYPKPILESL